MNTPRIRVWRRRVGFGWSDLPRLPYGLGDNENAFGYPSTIRPGIDRRGVSPMTCRMSLITRSFMRA